MAADEASELESLRAQLAALQEAKQAAAQAAQSTPTPSVPSVSMPQAPSFSMPSFSPPSFDVAPAVSDGVQAAAAAAVTATPSPTAGLSTQVVVYALLVAWLPMTYVIVNAFVNFLGGGDDTETAAVSNPVSAAPSTSSADGPGFLQGLRSRFGGDEDKAPMAPPTGTARIAACRHPKSRCRRYCPSYGLSQ